MITICLPDVRRIRSGWLLATLLAVPAVFAAPTDDVYSLGPDSQQHEGVPRGKVIGPLTLASQVFTNTTRHYWIYVPAQYDPKQPAALMIFQDGQAFVSLTGDYRIPNVLDNLIYRREMPVTIAVFINPGHLPNQPESSSTNWGDGINNRVTEYNELNDHYTKLIMDELLPALEKDYNISRNPENRALAGASSGAICAFTVAWQRPDQFHKVISVNGSFTDLRGGHVYPDLIRQSERKPIRIFLQDGLNDNRVRGRNGEYDPKRDWYAQNLKMAEALTAKGYDVNYCWGIGTHSGKQGGAIMPEMLRWLWRDYPRPDDPKDDRNRKLFVAADNPAAAAGQTSPSGEVADITYSFPGIPVEQLLAVYASLAKEKIRVPANMDRSRVVRFITPQPVTRTQALKLIEAALQEQVQLTINRSADGTLVGTEAAMRTYLPNGQIEPPFPAPPVPSPRMPRGLPGVRRATNAATGDLR